MQKIKFDFEAKKHFIYTPNSAVPIGAPVDENGNIANDGNAIGIVLGYDNVNKKYWTKQMMVVMVGGYVDIIDAQAIWGDEYSAEAIAAMSDIVFCDNHKIGGGGGGGGMVVNFDIQLNSEEMIVSVTADKTPAEVLEMLKTSVVIGNASGILGNVPVGCALIDANISPAFCFINVDENGQPRYLICTVDGDWVVNIA